MKEKLIHITAKTINPVSWFKLGKMTVLGTPKMAIRLYTFFTFFILLVVFISEKTYSFFEKLPFLGKGFKKLGAIFQKTIGNKLLAITSKIEKTKASEIKRTYLIEIAYKNLLSKKTRTAITILGMSVGVGVIVLLLSLGYGIENLIITQVASLDELKVVDVSASSNTALHLDNVILNRVKNLADVTKVEPIASFVAKMTYNNALTDVVVYSASNEYMQLSHLKLIKGDLFTNNNSYTAYGGSDVAGASIQVSTGKIGSEVSADDIYFNIPPETFATAYSSCDISSDIVGVVTRVDGGLEGKEYWGATYNTYDDAVQGYDAASGKYIGKWIKSSAPLFYQTTDNKALPYLDENGRQKWQSVCFKESELQVTERLSFASVLGTATQSASVTTNPSAPQTPDNTAIALNNATVVSTSSAGIEIVSLQPVNNQPINTTIPFKTGSSQSAIVSTALLKIFNIPLNEAVGTTFSSSFTIVKALIPSIQGNASTAPINYKIVGVIDDATSPYIYIPLHDIESLGISNFSQLKVVLTDKAYADTVRKKIGNMGFATSSTLDTVSQIESLFSNIRIVLALLGLVALGVASLGMFNTLTVSLLERTREIGGMKTMGMVSNEVQDLFLSEAMMMGMAGGVGGLILGYIAGQLLSFLVSLLAYANGQSYLSLTYIPPYLTIFIIISSFVVGIFTGFYPSQRAKKISALDALRYE